MVSQNRTRLTEGRNGVASYSKKEVFTFIEKVLKGFYEAWIPPG